MAIVSAIIGAAALAAAGLTILPVFATGVPSPSTPSVDYQFNGSLADSAAGSSLTVTPTCPSTPPPDAPDNQCVYTSGFAADADGPHWTWTAPGKSVNRRGGGFTVQTNTPMTGTYTLALKFSYSTTMNAPADTYLKIIDYVGKASDNGFYFYMGMLNSYPGDTGPTVYSAGQVLDLVATRDDATKEFKVYSRAVGGALVLEYTYDDSDDDMLPFSSGSGSLLGFFFDDNVTPGSVDEATDGGKVYRLRTWNGVALTQAQINGATSSTPVVVTDSLPAGTIGTAYSQALEAGGGVTPYSNWQVASGSLPAGLTLAPSTGLISGTPTATGTSSFTLTVTDSASSPAVSPATPLTLVIAAPTPAPAPPAPAPPAPAADPTPTPTATATASPAATVPPLDPIASQQNGNVPATGLPLGSGLLLVAGVPTSVVIAPNSTTDPTGLVATGPGFTMRLAGLNAQGQPLGLSTDGGALVLEQDRMAQVAGTGFLPSSEVRLYVFSEPRYIGSITTDASGNFSGEVPIPKDLAVGRHTLQANGYSQDTNVRSLSLGVMVRPDRAPRVRTAQATVTFAPMSSTLSDGAKAQLRALLKSRKGTAVRTLARGFVQPTSIIANDQSLSMARAESVKSYLRGLGLKGPVTARGDGVASETGAAGRKVSISIRYTL
jgi:outer membrane protein OmpA-like peptidoglycan-associated protein